MAAKPGTPRRYAEGTTVRPETSMGELRRVVNRYGGSNLTIAEDDDDPAVSALFTIERRWVRFRQPMPAMPAKPSQQAGRDREVRRRWRVLILKVKGRLEEYREGGSTFEETLLPFVVLPDNRTVAEALGPQLAALDRDGTMPALPKPGRPP